MVLDLLNKLELLASLHPNALPLPLSRGQTSELIERLREHRTQWPPVQCDAAWFIAQVGAAIEAVPPPDVEALEMEREEEMERTARAR